MPRRKNRRKRETLFFFKEGKCKVQIVRNEECLIVEEKDGEYIEV